MDIVKRLAEEFQLKTFQVTNTISLIDEGNTIPFIARYRKEQTGNLKDTVLREFYDRLNYLRNLQKRQEDIIRLIDEQGKLTDKLKEEILKADTLQRLEDLYRPFRPRRRTRATIAREKGLEGLANIILNKRLTEEELYKIAKSYINKEKGVMDGDEALKGAMDIIAEIISDNAQYRDMIRDIAYKKG